MLYVAYFSLILTVLVVLVRRPRSWLAGTGHWTTVSLRLAGFLIAALSATAGVVLAVGLAREPEHPFSVAWLAYFAFSFLALGGVLYAVGTVVWQGSTASKLRTVSWVCMVAPLAIPSQATLALPLIAPLFFTLEPIWRCPSRRAVAPS